MGQDAGVLCIQTTTFFTFVTKAFKSIYRVKRFDTTRYFRSYNKQKRNATSVERTFRNTVVPTFSLYGGSVV